MKLLRNILVVAFVLAIALTLPVTTFANQDGEVGTMGDPGGLSGTFVTYHGYNYYNDISFTHIAENQTSTIDTVSYTVSRTKSSSHTANSTLEADSLVARYGISMEIGWGRSHMVSTTCSWTVPAYSIVECRYGSTCVTASATEEKWFNGILRSTRHFGVDYTHTSYSGKVMLS